MVFPVKQSNVKHVIVKLCNSGKNVVQMICIMKSCNITSRSLIIARISDSNKTTAKI
jgi:hypothetical protein